MVAESGKAAIGAAKLLVETTKDTSGGKDAAEEFGKTALTVTKAINNVLLPIAAVNFAFDKGRAYFDNFFQSDLEEKTKDIPADEFREPKASLSAPALQGLAFSHEEPNLKEMYLQLLATAMDKRKGPLDHPSFAEIIRQLSGDEAGHLRQVLDSANPMPIGAVVRKTNNPKGELVLFRHVIDVVDTTTGKQVEIPGFQAMVDNWIRLGLISVDYMRALVRDGAYDWMETRPEYIAFRERSWPDGDTVAYNKGILNVTEFGKNFGRAVL